MTGVSDKTEHRPRLSVDITKDQQDALRELIPHGLLKPVMSLVIDDIIKMLSNCSNETREKFIIMAANKSISLRGILPTLSGD